jgi:hypothetical protein
MKVSYAVGHAWARTLLIQYVVSILWVLIAFVWICKLQLIFFMECEWVYEDLEGFCPFQNTHLEDVQIVEFSKITQKVSNLKPAG